VSAFVGALSTFALQGREAMDQVVREVVYQCGLTLVRLSPIDTGRFSSNWNYGLETPDTRYNAEEYNVRFVNYMGEMPNKAGGYTHFITNATPYGPYLERGSSDQAPQGMVGLTVAAFSDIVHVAAMKVRK
jgi:hypothetical protein